MSSIRCWVVLTLVSGAAALLAMAQGPTAPPTQSLRNVHYNIAITDDTQTPVSGIPLCISGSDTSAWRVTDSTGKARARVPSLRSSIVETIMYVIPEELVGAPTPEQETKLAAQRVLRETYAFPSDTFVVMQPNVDTYTVNIVTPRACRVTMNVRTSAGAGVEGDIAALGWEARTAVPASGQALLAGVPRGRDVVLAFVSPSVEWGVFRDVPASALQDATATLTDWIITEPTLTCQISGQISGRESIPRAEGMFKYFATFVRSDGEAVFRCGINKDGNVQKSPSDPVAFNLPVGTYYVVPGTVSTSRFAVPVRALLKAGQSAALDAAGVTKVVVGEGEQSKTIAFNVETLRASCATACGLPR